MRPYFEKDGISIYHGDSRAVLSKLIATYNPTFDLLLSDPPYLTQKVLPFRGEGVQITNDDQDQMIYDCLTVAIERVRKGRHIYLFGEWRGVVEEMGTSDLTELIWFKGQPRPGPHDIPWGPAHEPITFGVRVAMHEIGAEKAPVRMRRGTVLAYPVSPATPKCHPAEKPVEMLREIIESSSRPGELVIDPFVGSGSSMIATYLEGRVGIGIDVDEKSCEIAARRLSRTTLGGEDRSWIKK